MTKRVLPLAVIVAAAIFPHRVCMAQGPVHAVLFTHRVTNVGDKQADNVVAICILPASNRYQEIIARELDLQPIQTETDAEGQDVVLVPLGSIAPGQTRSARVMAWLRFKRVNVRLVRNPERAESLDDDVRKALLADDPAFEVEKVREKVESIVADKKRDIDKAKAMYQHMAEHCKYDIDEKLDPPSQVLEGTPASCSELAVTYTAMCRAAGIPARLLSAYVNREGTRPSVDWRTHRWVEIFADEIGWVPVDPTNRLNYPKDHFFGKQFPKYLTVVDDGADLQKSPDPSWKVSLAYREPADAELTLSRTASWRVSVDRQAETDAFKTVMEDLGGNDPDERKAAIGGWDGHLMRTGFLLEACYDDDPEVRKAAAEAVGQTRDMTVMIALMDLARADKDESVKKALVAAARHLLKTADDEHRAKAVKELAKSRADEALELLDDIWKDRSKDVRKAAAHMLYKFGDKPKVHKNYKYLANDTDDFIAIVAAMRWSRLGAKKAFEHLVGYLESSVRWDRTKALEALVEHSGDDFGFNPRFSPHTRNNQDAISKFEDWLDDLDDEK